MDAMGNNAPHQQFIPFQDVAGGIARIFRTQDDLLAIAAQAFDEYLAIDAGSVALAGSNASLLRGKKVFADAGAVALTAASASLRRTAYQAVSAGSYILTGQPSTGRHTYKITAGAAALALAGGAASLTATRTLSLGVGSVASAVQNAATLCGRAVFTEAGAYDYTGFDIDMRKGIDGLAALVEPTFSKDRFAGHLFVFVGKAGDKVKVALMLCAVVTLVKV